jgi:hypothetical protein
MDWVRSHLYVSALGLALGILLVGTLVVYDRSTPATPSGITAWSGTPSTFDSITVPIPRGDSSVVEATSSYGATGTLPYTQNFPVSYSEGTIQNTTAGSSNDLKALLAVLSHPQTRPSTSSDSASGQSIANTWDFIPAGIISTTSRPGTVRSAIQQSLFAYGNEVGSYVEGYDAAHHGQVEVMKDAMSDRLNVGKQQALARIGTDLETVGQGIASLSDIPSAAMAFNTALANSYVDSGKKLVALATTLTDRDPALVATIESYDTAVVTFTKNYVALAGLFSAYGVTFESTDPGSVFTFSHASL